MKMARWAAVFVPVVLGLVLACGGAKQDDPTEWDTSSEEELWGEATEEEAIAEEEAKAHTAVTLDMLLAAPVEVEFQWYQYMDSTEMDDAAMKLLCRIMSMYELCSTAADDWVWCQAVDTLAHQFMREKKVYLSQPQEFETAIAAAKHQIDWYDFGSQLEMNLYSTVDARLDYLRVVYKYRQMAAYWSLGDKLKKMPKLLFEEFSAWHNWATAQYQVYHREKTEGLPYYSMLPMELNAYAQWLTENRMRMLSVEEEVIEYGTVYKQQGKTVTGEQWQKVRAAHASDTAALDAAEQWIAARQRIVRYLSAQKSAYQGSNYKKISESYDCITADIHSRIAGTLAPVVPEEYYEI